MDVIEAARKVLEQWSSHGTWKGRWKALSDLEKAMGKASVTKWEYHVQDFISEYPAEELQEWLNMMGEEGWELIAYRPASVAPAMLDEGYSTDRVVLRRLTQKRASMHSTFLPPVS